MKMPLLFFKKCQNSDTSRISEILEVDETWIHVSKVAPQGRVNNKQ